VDCWEAGPRPWFAIECGECSGAVVLIEFSRMSPRNASSESAVCVCVLTSEMRRRCVCSAVDRWGCSLSPPPPPVGLTHSPNEITHTPGHHSCKHNKGEQGAGRARSQTTGQVRHVIQSDWTGF